MEPNNSVMAGLKLECVAAEDPQGNCAYTDDARRSRGPDHSGSNHTEVSEQSSEAGFRMFVLKVELEKETLDPDLAEAEDPFTVLNIQVKKEPVSDSGDETSNNVSGSRGPNLSGCNHASVTEQPSGAGLGVFGLKVNLKTETPDPDMTKAEDPFTTLNLKVKKETVSENGDETRDNVTGSRGPDLAGSSHASVSKHPSGSGLGMFGLKTETPDPDMTEAEDPRTTLNLQVKKETVSNSGDETRDDVTEGCDVSNRDRQFTFSNSDLHFDNDDNNTNNKKEINKGLIENLGTKATNSSTKTSGASSKDTICYNRDVIQPRKLFSMEKKFNCHLCSSAFVKFISLKYHMSFYHGQKYHKALAQHTETQTQIVSSCQKMRQQHFDEEDTSKELSDHQEILNKCLKCNLCGKAFSRLDSLKRHQLIHIGDKPYQCSNCNKAFNLSKDLKRHQRIHTGEKPYQCTDCNKAFSQSQTLKTHQRMHTGDKPYQCTDCDKAFNQLTHLKIHQLIHTGVKPYQCTDCNKAFNQSHDLKRHQHIHTGDKPYQCSNCKKAFNRSEDLKRHQHIHTGEKPYQCMDCKKAFNRSENLKRHQLIHTEDKPYQCMECNKAFNRLISLKTHQRIHVDEGQTLPVYGL